MLKLAAQIERAHPEWFGAVRPVHVTPIERVTGTIMTQMLPLADEKRLEVYAPFNSGLCGV